MRREINNTKKRDKWNKFYVTDIEKELQFYTIASNLNPGLITCKYPCYSFVSTNL